MGVKVMVLEKKRAAQGRPKSLLFLLLSFYPTGLVSVASCVPAYRDS